MKKNLLLFAVMLSCGLGGYAQGEKQALKKIEETVIGDYDATYYYRPDGLIDYRVGNDYYGTYKVTFTYDENNNVVKRELFSDDAFGGWFCNGYTVYDYDSEGKMLRRRNWNSDDYGNFNENPDGDETYEYNEDGTLKQTTMMFLVGNNYELYNKGTYTYQNGRLVKFEVVVGNEEKKDSYDTYEYDGRGRLVWEGHYLYNGSAASLDTQRRYHYDRNSNLESEAYSIGTTVQDSTYYYYSNEKAEDFIYPVDLEEPKTYMDYLYNKMTGYQKYNLEESIGQLVKTETYEFTYGDMTSVESVKDAAKGNISVVVDSDFGFVLGLEDRDAEYAIYDLSGNMVKKGTLRNGTFDSYLLNNGVYVFSVNGQNAKFRK